MSTTRRALIKNATLASLAGATGMSPFLLSGCQRPRMFKEGIRIFFLGGWVFYADPFQPEQFMRAVTVHPDEFPNPPGPDVSPNPPMPHIFPYGIWFDDPTRNSAGHIDQWDLDNGSLPANKQSGPDGELVPYQVYVDGAWNPATNIDTLFRNTCNASSFTYLVNPTKLTVNCRNPGLRVLKLPYPTRIIPATFRHDAAVTSTAKDGAPVSIQPSSNTSRDTGFATNHIFEYEGASGMTFMPPGADPDKPKLISLSPGTGTGSDLHFHVVPLDYKDGHDKNMFTTMLCAIDPDLVKSLTLAVNSHCPVLPISKGALVPNSVPDRELEIRASLKECPQYNNKGVNPATCCSGGIGLGN